MGKQSKNTTENGSTAHSVPPHPSPEQVTQCLHSICAAFSELLYSAGADPSKVRASARHLGLNRGLTWRVCTLVVTDDLAVVARNIPAPESMQAILLACKNCGSSAETIERTRAVFREFDEIVKHFSGDRKSLAMILSSGETEDITTRQEGTRKLAYQANSTIWGVQAQTQFRSCFIAPSGSGVPGELDYATVSGLIGIRRLSHKIPWPIHVAGVRTDQGESVEQPYEPIDPTASQADDGPPILSKYCSPPAPEIRAVRSDSETVYELAGRSIGNAGIATVVFGSLWRSSQSQYRRENDAVLNFLTYLHTPVERVIMDLFIHRELAFQGPPEPMLIDRMVHPHGKQISIEEAERKRMPLTAELRELSPGCTNAATPHIPWYPSMLNDVHERAGWSPDDFVGYRLEMTYPPNPTAMVIGLTKLDQPQ